MQELHVSIPLLSLLFMDKLEGEGRGQQIGKRELFKPVEHYTACLAAGEKTRAQ